MAGQEAHRQRPSEFLEQYLAMRNDYAPDTKILLDVPTDGVCSSFLPEDAPTESFCSIAEPVAAGLDSLSDDEPDAILRGIADLQDSDAAVIRAITDNGCSTKSHDSISWLNLPDTTPPIGMGINTASHVQLEGHPHHPLLIHTGHVLQTAGGGSSAQQLRAAAAAEEPCPAVTHSCGQPSMQHLSGQLHPRMVPVQLWQQTASFSPCRLSHGMHSTEPMLAAEQGVRPAVDAFGTYLAGSQLLGQPGNRYSITGSNSFSMIPTAPMQPHFSLSVGGDVAAAAVAAAAGAPGPLLQPLARSGSSDSSSSCYDNDHNNSSMCIECASVVQQAPQFVAKLQQQLSTEEAAALKQEISLALGGVMGRCHAVSASQKPCCWSEQLPASLQPGDWCLTRPKARSAPRGRQRAEAGAATARNFNYGSNTPYLLDQTAASQLRQLLQGDAATAGASADLYAIRSTHTASGLLCIAVARLHSSEAKPGEEALWDRAAAVCKKAKLKGKSLDLLNAAFICCIGEQADAGSKRKAQSC